MRPSGSYETRTPGLCRCRSTMRADATRIVGAQPGNAAGEASTGMPGAGSWPGVDMPVKIDASGTHTACRRVYGPDSGPGPPDTHPPS